VLAAKIYPDPKLARDRRARANLLGLCCDQKSDNLPQFMRRSANKRKKLDYPEETEGSRLAAKVRKLASKLTPEEEAEHFRRGMAKAYGDQPKEIPGAGH
jgi:hypothetical protein